MKNAVRVMNPSRMLALLNAVVGVSQARFVAAPAPAPAASLEALHITFEIENINYYDLTKITCPKKTKMVNKGGKQVGPNTRNAMENFDEHVQRHAKEAIDKVQGHAKDIHDGVHEALGTEDAKRLPWRSTQEPGFLQLVLSTPVEEQGESEKWNERRIRSTGIESHTKDGCATVMVVLQEAIKKTVLSIIEAFLSHGIGPALGPAPSVIISPVAIGGPSPAAMLVPLPPQPLPTGVAAVFLQSRRGAPAPSPVPAPGPVALVPEVKVFVTFSPGRHIGHGRTIIVDIAFLDTPRNSMPDMEKVTPILHHAVNSGHLEVEIKKVIEKVTGVKPKVKKIEIGMKTIEQWPISSCEKHIVELVKNFTLHYTRAQVPMALYNECTNFMTRMSFSHDYVLDPLDTVRCRKATVALERHWEYGENAKAEDFADMCHKACEAKYGPEAPTCNIEHGDKLLGAPHL
jgi:hypothetical protein